MLAERRIWHSPCELFRAHRVRCAGQGHEARDGSKKGQLLSDAFSHSAWFGYRKAVVIVL